MVKNILTPEMAEVIKTMRKDRQPWEIIGTALNQKGFKTASGKPWAGGHVSSIALKHHLVERVKGTRFGPAGSTGYGQPLRPPKRRGDNGEANGNGNGHAVNGRALAASNPMTKIAEVAGSNLSDALKFEVIAMLAGKAAQ